jgi:hypothetical protein
MNRRLELALERLVEDVALTDPLPDDAARLLLDWGRACVKLMVTETGPLDPEEAWEQLNPRLQALRRKMRELARASAATSDPYAALKANLPALERSDFCDE